MNDSKLGITRENLLLIVPPALTHDPAMMARAAADAEALAARLAEIDRVRIIPNIDALDETVLDILARDFKVDWYDPGYSLEEKRRTVKSSWRVHKTLGTKAAVETAIRAIYPLTTVEEWFEYGGEPYHFRLNIDITSDSGDRARQKRVLERLNFYKSLRSHNDGVRYFLVPEKSWAVAGGLFAGSREIDRAAVRVPELAKPGGRTAAVVVGAFTGSRSAGRASVRVPPLARPQGAARRAVSTGCIGCIERVTVKLEARRVKVPTGRAATGGAAGMVHSYQRVRVSIGNPAITISGR